jgi:hypothetical protein
MVQMNEWMRRGTACAAMRSRLWALVGVSSIPSIHAKPVAAAPQSEGIGSSLGTLLLAVGALEAFLVGRFIVRRWSARRSRRRAAEFLALRAVEKVPAATDPASRHVAERARTPGAAVAPRPRDPAVTRWRPILWRPPFRPNSAGGAQGGEHPDGPTAGRHRRHSIVRTSRSNPIRLPVAGPAGVRPPPGEPSEGTTDRDPG